MLQFANLIFRLCKIFFKNMTSENENIFVEDIIAEAEKSSGDIQDGVVDKLQSLLKDEFCSEESSNATITQIAKNLIEEQVKEL
ncbi:MAG TPA: hypothetical protein DEA43_01145 [Candidatus Moranbacteria bacterium]|nr:hypothetical protein [Candidatus Moranbacteria bacterium]